MATANRVLQLLRSSRVYESKSAAITEVNGMTGADGEIRLARYSVGTYSGGDNDGKAIIKSLLCVYHASPSLETGNVAGWTFIEDASQGGSAITALQTELNNLEAQVGQDGASTTFASGATSGSDAEKILTGAQDNTGSAPTNLTNAVTNVATYIGTLDKAANAVDGKVVTTVSQANGQVSETQADLTDVKMGGYSKTSDTGAIAATDTLEVAVSKLENSIAKNEVASADASVTITQPSPGTSAGKTDLAVNVDGTTISKTNAGALQSVVKIVKQDANTSGVTLDSNVREQYVLADNTGAALTGDVIKIYKDSALTTVYLGTTGDSLSGQDAQTGESASSTVVYGSGEEALCFVYHLENGNYKLEAVSVESFLQESEFGNGLDVNTTTHVVSVKNGNGIEFDANNAVAVKPYYGITVDANGVGVDINSTNDNNSYLSVGADGVALNGNAIDAAIAAAKTTVTTVAAGTETTADGTDFIKITTTSPADADGHVNYEISTKGIRDAIAVETTRAESAETAIDSAVGLTKAANGEGRTYTSQVTLHGSEAAPTTVAGDIDLLDAHVEALDAAAVKTVTGSNAININTTSPNTAQAPKVELILDDTTQGTGSELTGNYNALTVTSDGLFLSNIWDCGTY